MGWTTGIEPATTGITIRGSTNWATSTIKQEQHWAASKDGAPGRIRTCDPRLRRPLLYPTELRAQILKAGKWSGMRDSNPRHPAPKAGALPDCANPRLSYQAVSLASAHNTDRACFRQCEITTSDKNIREFFQMLINRTRLDEILCL